MSRSVTIARIHLESIEFYRHPAIERLEKILENMVLPIAGHPTEMVAKGGISEAVKNDGRRFQKG